MRNGKIKISDNGIITIPSETKMSVAEIAELFGIYYQTAKRHIRSIQKSGVADGDYLMSCVVEGQKVVPEYYGLEMVIAVAFRVKSRNADIFREWLLQKATKPAIPQIPNVLIFSTQNSSLN